MGGKGKRRVVERKEKKICNDRGKNKISPSNEREYKINMNNRIRY